MNNPQYMYTNTLPFLSLLSFPPLSQFGGGIYIVSSTVTMSDMSVNGNTASVSVERIAQRVRKGTIS